MVAVGVYGIERPDVRLHQTKADGEGEERADDDDGAADGAEALLLERVADGDVALDREAEDEQRRQVLRDVVHGVEDLARHVLVVRLDPPRHVQLDEYVQDEEHEVGDGQRAQVDGRRVVAAGRPAEPDVGG